VKIGYHTTLHFLRRGANVIATARFPIDAIERYKQETDYTEWNNRLHIEHLDLRSHSNVISFCEKVKQYTNNIYCLVNNAAQTVKRPDIYYNSLEDVKQHKGLKSLKGPEHSEIYPLNVKDIENVENVKNVKNVEPDNWLICSEVDFPINQKDIDGQQLDIRTQNSWTQTIEDVDIRECMETQVINSVAPFCLIQLFQKKGLFENSYILNITSQEGRFDQDIKGPTHPHNNMSKASFNMITKTIGYSFRKRYSTQVISIDPGWINSMVGATKMGLLEYSDAVARIIQPLVDNTNYTAQLLRHFKVTDKW